MVKKYTLQNKGNGFPGLRVALTSRCNLRCEYCPPRGENFAEVKKPIQREELFKILKIFYKIGFRQFGFTGGEPLLKKDLLIILKMFSKFEDKYLKLYTNGTLFKNKAKVLKEFDLIKLSLDSIDRTRYKELTGKDSLQDVLKTIELATINKTKLRINAVLTKKNYDGIFKLINFCREKKVDLKILDLNCFEIPGYQKWNELYISPSVITLQLEKLGLNKKTIYTTGNYGIPMAEFKWDGINIRVKDTKKSSMYSPICKKCKFYLCQEGLYHLTLTSDGKLKMCRHRSDIYVDLRNKKTSEIEEKIRYFLNKHYFLAKRIFSPKQVFLGYFGKDVHGKRE